MIDYEYINTRLRILELKSISSEDLRELLSRTEGLDAIKEYLKKTSYGIHVSEETGDIVFLLDRALRLHFSETMREILQICKGVGGNLVETILSIWDLYNIKTLLRGKIRAISSEEITTSLMPAGSLREIILIEVYRQPSVQAMVDMLITMGYTFVWPLKQFKYISEAHTIVAETELEKSFYSHALKRIELSHEKDKNKAIAKEVLRLIIDRANLLLVLKGLTGRIPPEEILPYYIRGGRLITIEVFKKMLECKSISECISLIWSEIWRFRWEIYRDTYPHSDISFMVERWLDYEILKYSWRLSRQDPFNISYVIACIWRKVHEIVNLRMIIKGIQYGIPREEIEKSIISCY